jgi:hypothetical protein
MICQAIQPVNSKSPRNTKKHPTTPTVLLSCQFLTSPSRSRQQEGSNRHATGPLAASLARLPIGGRRSQHSNYLASVMFLSCRRHDDCHSGLPDLRCAHRRLLVPAFSGVGGATAVLMLLSGWLYARFGQAGFWLMGAFCTAALPVIWLLHRALGSLAPQQRACPP